MKTAITALLYLFWIVLGYLGLLQAGRRFFTGRYRAEVCAGAVVIAFAVGLSVPRGGAADVAAPAPPVAVSTASLPPPPAVPVTDVAKACGSARLSAAVGKGNMDAAAIVSGGHEAPAGSLPDVHPGDTLVLRGWAANPELKAPVAAACAVIDGRIVASTKGLYGAIRPDVAAAFATPSLAATGFQLLVASSAIPLGHHRIQTAAVAADGTATVISGSLALISTN